MTDLTTAVQIASIAEPGDTYLGEVLSLYSREINPAVIRAFLADLERGGPMPTPTGYSPAHPEPDHAKLQEQWRRRMPTADNLAFIIEKQQRLGFSALLPGTEAFPKRMTEKLGFAAPNALFVLGDVNALHMKAIAIVGARAATGYGQHAAQEITIGLSERGWGIVSGGAYGIDATAHRAALASQQSTVAYLAGGIGNFYPSGNESLLERVSKEQGCAVVSELPPGFTPTRWRFLKRNRLIASNANALVVVEAGMRSGSLNAASHARAASVPVGAVPGPITSAASMGTHELIRTGQAKLIVNAEQAAELAL